MNISLIGNSGIQFHQFIADIDCNADVIAPIGFNENRPKPTSPDVELEFATYLPDHDYWVPKSALRYHDFLDKDDRIKEDLNPNVLKAFKLKDGEDFYSIGDFETCLDYFLSSEENLKWIPIPYFRESGDSKHHFGPIAWSRMLITEVIDPNARKGSVYGRRTLRKFQIVLAFDTKVIENNAEINYSPVASNLETDENVFSFAKNDELLLNFCNSKCNCDWVERYIRNLISGDVLKDEFPVFKHVGHYVYFLKFLAHLEKNGDFLFPKVTLYNDTQVPIDVDLVLDIGNSNTCGILFESPKGNLPFNFNRVKKLALRDLTRPWLSYQDPFAMRLAFHKPRFGEFEVPEHKCFLWPSLLRLGKEAERLITEFNFDEDRGVETACHYSSPKRYLWDGKMSEIPWEFCNKSMRHPESIYFEGISEQFKADGSYAKDGVFSFSPNYSRRSLMTFVYMEIILQAISQINSFEFRTDHGFPYKPRKLKRITITCPTSIIQKEQFWLREAAQTAVFSLKRFFKDAFLGAVEDDTEDKGQEFLEIIPSPKDLSKRADQIAFKKDWMYDEATCSQFVFLYAEIAKRYLNDAEKYFELFGRKRNDVTDIEKKAITIASLDIGGGTTDLMISTYQYEKGQNNAVLNPNPLFWESFNFAGDDLLKEIVQQIIIEGNSSKPAAENKTGIIRNAAIKAGVTNVNEKILSFFGSDNARQTYLDRIQRKNFIVQVANPIALKYIEHTISGNEDKEVNFDYFFPVQKPNKKLIEYFNNKFSPLKLEDIKWNISAKVVSEVTEATFDPMLKQISAIVAGCGSDFLLLTGKPTTIPRIREMFIKYFPVSPDRIISLNSNQYRIGRWYPFANEKGYLNDPKTIVAVGALIGLMGGKLDRLSGFRINTSNLKTRLTSLADFIGPLNQYTQLIDPLYITPDTQSADFELHTLPMKFGFKQLPNIQYRAKPIFKVDFNEEEITRKLIDQNPILGSNPKLLNLALEDYKDTKRNAMPFKVRIQRNKSDGKENITIIRVVDGAKNELSKTMLDFGINTLAEEHSYWLDTGEFILNLK